MFTDFAEQYFQEGFQEFALSALFIKERIDRLDITALLGRQQMNQAVHEKCKPVLKLLFADIAKN